MKRDYPIDLFRILATILVILLHVLGQGGILQAAAPGQATYWTGWFFEIMAYCAVNCFALISGYIMVDKRIKLKNIIARWIQVLFYSLLISTLFFAFVPETRTLWNVAVAVLPVTGKQWWYISAYFALFFFIPLLNKAIHHISQATYRKFLLVILVGVCLIDRIIPMDSFSLSGGYSAAWLILVYLFGAYIKKYQVYEKITALKSALGFLGMTVLTFLSKFTLYFATEKVLGEVKYDETLVSYTSVTILLASVFLLMLCLKIKIGGFAQAIIRWFAPMTLGVYLIHVHPLVFEYIVKDAFVALALQHPARMVISALGWTLALFLLCSALDFYRIKLFGLIRIDRLCEWADRKINHLYCKAFQK